MRNKILLVVASLAAVAFAALSVHEKLTNNRMKREIWTTFFAALRPERLANCTLERFGSPSDGGYLMCGNLLGGVESAYSYGIAGDDNWGCDISKRSRVTTHQYDCFDLRHPACPGGAVDFHEACVGVAAARVDGRVFDTLSNQIDQNGDTGKHMVVKMDVEGAELDVLSAASDQLLGQIDQLVVEFHGIDDLKAVRLLQKLKTIFHIAYVHANNIECPTTISPFTSGANEVLFVNRRLAVVDNTGSAAPAVSPLATPNYPDQPDCQPKWP